MWRNRISSSSYYWTRLPGGVGISAYAQNYSPELHKPFWNRVRKSLILNGRFRSREPFRKQLFIEYEP